MSNKKGVAIVAGVGNGSGTGAAAAKLFAKNGYCVALIARRADLLEKTTKVVEEVGGEEAVAFPVVDYTADALSAVFSAIRTKWPASTHELRVALWNTAHNHRQPFLSFTDAEVARSLDVNVRAAFAFARHAILGFKENELDERGKRGTLLFTGATASRRGNVTTSAFSAGKFGTRALSQSLNKEFGACNIHVAHVVIDGPILTDALKMLKNDKEWEQDVDAHLKPESVAHAFLYLVSQDRSAWTWELDLRPAHEKW